MNTLIDDLKSERKVCKMRVLVVDQSIGCHLKAIVRASPCLSGCDQRLADAAPPQLLADEPALDKANRSCWIAAIRVRAQTDQDESGQRPGFAFGDEHDTGQPSQAVRMDHRFGLFAQFFDRCGRPKQRLHLHQFLLISGSCLANA